jgi:hypothetical protein
MSAGLIDTPVKTAFESEVEAHAMPVKQKRLFSGSQNNQRKIKPLKRMFKELTYLERKVYTVILVVGNI